MLCCLQVANIHLMPKTVNQHKRLMFRCWSLGADLVLCPAAAEIDDEVSDAMLKEVCITEQTQIYFMNNDTSFSRTVDCGNCSR